MSQSRPRFIGMDVHKDSLAVASVAQDHGAEVMYLGAIGTRQGDLAQLIRTMPAKAHHRIFVYEAGPGGDWLSRDLTNKGDDGWVVAPSLMPPKAGDRVTTARRDARPWARLARSGDLTPVDVPTGDDDAMRDLTRAREETLSDLQDATCRLNAFWLRHAIRDTGRATWNPAHLRWLAEVVGPTPAQHIVLQAYVRAVTEHPARLQRLEQALHARVNSWRLRPVVAALQAVRGVPCTVAVTMVAERGHLTRVDHPRALMKGLGLSPSAYSTGERRRHGSMTQAGNTHARRALVEGAWASRDPAQGSRHLQRRLAQPPNALQDLSWKAPVRLCQRYRNRLARGKHANQVVVAMARALRGCLWAIANEVPVAPSAAWLAAH